MGCEVVAAGHKLNGCSAGRAAELEGGGGGMSLNNSWVSEQQRMSRAFTELLATSLTRHPAVKYNKVLQES